ncbi:hypothetical protein EVAR_34751_1 [Eumeta japonica]|uniref:Uncharacterized protein n=1 Tax=Eumeta variegata TaxID=151549 RepID=A0A4C1YK73_EUMVA|nr:hypothetical protein EVAR_34751_1 [Eumeta japonica]
MPVCAGYELTGKDARTDTMAYVNVSCRAERPRPNKKLDLDRNFRNSSRRIVIIEYGGAAFGFHNGPKKVAFPQRRQPPPPTRRKRRRRAGARHAPAERQQPKHFSCRISLQSRQLRQIRGPARTRRGQNKSSDTFNSTAMGESLNRERGDGFWPASAAARPRAPGKYRRTPESLALVLFYTRHNSKKLDIHAKRLVHVVFSIGETPAHTQASGVSRVGAATSPTLPSGVPRIFTPCGYRIRSEYNARQLPKSWPVHREFERDGSHCVSFESTHCCGVRSCGLFILDVQVRTSVRRTSLAMRMRGDTPSPRCGVAAGAGPVLVRAVDARRADAMAISKIDRFYVNSEARRGRFDLKFQVEYSNTAVLERGHLKNNDTHLRHLKFMFSKAVTIRVALLYTNMRRDRTQQIHNHLQFLHVLGKPKRYDRKKNAVCGAQASDSSLRSSRTRMTAGTTSTKRIAPFAGRRDDIGDIGNIGVGRRAVDGFPQIFRDFGPDFSVKTGFRRPTTKAVAALGKCGRNENELINELIALKW